MCQRRITFFPCIALPQIGLVVTFLTSILYPALIFINKDQQSGLVQSGNCCIPKYSEFNYVQLLDSFYRSLHTALLYCATENHKAFIPYSLSWYMMHTFLQKLEVLEKYLESFSKYNNNKKVELSSYFWIIFSFSTCCLRI